MTIGVGLLFLMTAFGHPLRNWSYDVAFFFRPHVSELSEVVIVIMDDDSHGKLGQQRGEGQTWHRLLHASLIKELNRQGARAVVFDLLIDEPWTQKAVSLDSERILINDFGYTPGDLEPHRVDLLFSNAVWESSAAGTPVVFAAGEEKEGRGQAVLKRPTRILGTNVSYGSYHFPGQPGHIVRQHNCHINPPSLAWTVADILGQSPPLGSLPVEETFMNYYGPRETLTYLTYNSVVRGNANTDVVISNRVVFIGKERLMSEEGPTVVRDELATPFTRWKSSETPGVEVQATAFLNLYRSEWLVLIRPWQQFLLVIAFGALAGTGLTAIRPWIAARVALLGAVLCAVAGIGLVWTTRHWFPWLTLAAVQLPVALSWSVFANTKRVYREKAVLEESLATARTGRLKAGAAADRNSDSITTIAPPPRPDDTLGPDIPDHTLLRRIGKGAYGEVWLARDIIGSFHAVKVVYRDTFSSESPYLREFRGLQKFTPISRQHPSLVQVLHVGRNEKKGYFYCIMEVGDDEQTGQDIHPDSYAPRTLSQEIDKRLYLPASECIDLGCSLADALEFLHQKKLIHRDIKPSNIIYVNGVPKFADVGLVTDIVTQDHRDVTYLGTEGFIPPEGPGTAAADVFSLGKLLYEACMGRDRQRFPELPTALDEMPDQELLLALNPIILKACEGDVLERYQSAAELRRDLEALR